MAWYNVFKKSGEAEQVTADEYDILAVILRFASVKERSFAFYQKHRPAVDVALDFIASLRAESREMSLLLMGSGDPLEKLSANLRKRLATIQLSNNAQLLVENAAQTIIPQLEPMLADTSRPNYLDEARWVMRSCALKVAMPSVVDDD